MIFFGVTHPNSQHKRCSPESFEKTKYDKILAHKINEKL